MPVASGDEHAPQVLHLAVIGGIEQKLGTTSKAAEFDTAARTGTRAVPGVQSTGTAGRARERPVMTQGRRCACRADGVTSTR